MARCRGDLRRVAHAPKENKSVNGERRSTSVPGEKGVPRVYTRRTVSVDEGFYSHTLGALTILHTSVHYCSSTCKRM